MHMLQLVMMTQVSRNLLYDSEHCRIWQTAGALTSNSTHLTDPVVGGADGQQRTVNAICHNSIIPQAV